MSFDDTQVTHKFRNPFSKMSKMILSFVRGGRISQQQNQNSYNPKRDNKLSNLKSNINSIESCRKSEKKSNNTESNVSHIANRLPRLVSENANRKKTAGVLSSKIFGVYPTPPSANISSSSIISDQISLGQIKGPVSIIGQTVLCCDKCDGKHETDDCPYYKKKREDHPDAQKNSLKKLGGASNLPGAFLRDARVVRQPGDGSCLFHSMSYGLKDGSNATRLRSEICAFIKKNPNLEISDTPLSDWVKWDSGSSVAEYASRMAYSAWGGGIEMASLSVMKGVNVHVYERMNGCFKRISAFDHPDNPENRKTVKVLYCGGVHYGNLFLYFFFNFSNLQSYYFILF